MTSLIPHTLKPLLGYRIDPFHPLAKGLVACYLMNEKGDIKIRDLTGKGNTGTFVNDTHWVAGPNGPAVDFDGTNDYINLGNFLGAGISLFTVALWFRPDVLTGRNVLINQWGDSGDRVFIFEYGTAGDGQVEFTVSSTGASFFRSFETVASVTESTEYNVVGVIDGTNVLLYVDGKLRNLGAAFNQTLFNETVEPIKIGEISTGGASADYNGIIDKCYIWVNRVLSASEVAQLYLEPYAFIERPLSKGALFVEEIVAAGIVPILEHHYRMMRNQ